MSLFLKALPVLLLAGQAMAAPVQCPRTLDVTQQATGIPAGMRAFDAEPHHVWTNAQFSDGPPNEQAWLAPDNTRKSGKTFTNQWNLEATPGGTWLSCAYTGTSLILSYRLPDTIKICTIQYDNNTSPPSALAIDCR